MPMSKFAALHVNLICVGDRDVLWAFLYHSYKYAVDVAVA
jgi:hypothetical protein